MLTLKAINLPGFRSNRPQYALCREDGSPLPNQVEVAIAQDEDGMQHVTVTFAVDGENICVEKSA